MNWRKLGIFLLMLVFAATMVVGCGDSQDNDAQAPDQSQQEEFKVGFIYIGAPGDAGWTFAHDQGRKYLEEQIPGIKTITWERAEVLTPSVALNC